MDQLVGTSGVLLAFLASVVGCATVVFRIVRKPGGGKITSGGITYAALALFGAVAATAAIEHALLTHDFALQYVAENNSVQTPILYSISGMWSALEGSILLWGLVLTLYICGFVLVYKKRKDDEFIGWATAVALAVSAFFFGLMLGPASPFRHVSGHIPTNGPGPNPLLQDHPLVAFHPPILYAGLVGFTIPFAMAISALVTGRLGRSWLVDARRWALASWGFLGVGVILGAWWSYQVLGWGGFWAWDPVENAALIPLLVGTAFIHSAMVQEKRGILKVWNISLIISAFSLTILATFLTRSGVLESVHAFSGSQGSIGISLISLFAVVLVGGAALIAWRADDLRSSGKVVGVVSREGSILLNNLLFSGFAVVVLVGTVFPLLVQAANGQQVTVGNPYFGTMTRPLGLALLFLMGVAPLLPWGRVSGRLLHSRLIWPALAGVATLVVCVVAGVKGGSPLVTYTLAAFSAASAFTTIAKNLRVAWRRSPLGFWRGVLGRSTGGMVVHLGVISIALAMASSLSFGQRTEVSLKPNQSVIFDRHTFTFLGMATVVLPNRHAYEALVAIDGSKPFHPALSQFNGDTEDVGTPAVDSGLWDDVYLTIDRTPSSATSAALIGIVIQPMVIWLWIGGGLVATGTALAFAGPKAPTKDQEETNEGIPEIPLADPSTGQDNEVEDPDLEGALS